MNTLSFFFRRSHACGSTVLLDRCLREWEKIVAAAIQRRNGFVQRSQISCTQGTRMRSLWTGSVGRRTAKIGWRKTRRKSVWNQKQSKSHDFKSQNHNIVGEIVTICFGPFRQAVGNRLGRIALIVAPTIVVHVIDHVKALLNRIDEELLQLGVTDAACQNGQHLKFVRLIFAVCLEFTANL